MGDGGSEGRPILIVGVSRRSGTNFLGSILTIHRDCGAPAPPVAEDHLLVSADVLERYVDSTARRWPHRWGDRRAGTADLRAALADGLLAFLSSRTDAPRVVARTPDATNLTLAPCWYAGADVVLLVRDGRSVAASFERAWRWPLDLAILEWRRGAREMLDLLSDPEREDHGARFLLVRFEDIVRDLPSEVARLLEFTGLDPEGFDMSSAADLPVLGSSFDRDADGKVTWQPRDRPVDFDPSERHATWSSARLDRFEWLAGDEMRGLGYELASPPGGFGRTTTMNLRDVSRPVVTAPWRVRRAAETTYRRRRSDRRAERDDQRPPETGPLTSATTSASARANASES